METQVRKRRRALTRGGGSNPVAVRFNGADDNHQERRMQAGTGALNLSSAENDMGGWLYLEGAAAWRKATVRGITSSDFTAGGLPRRVAMACEVLGDGATSDSVLADLIDRQAVGDKSEVLGALNLLANPLATCQGEDFTLGQFIKDARRRRAVQLNAGLAHAIDEGDEERAAKLAEDLAAAYRGTGGGTGRVPSIELTEDGALCEKNTPLPPPLIDGLVNRGEVTLLSASSKAGKSWFLLQAAKCVGAGIPFLGFPTVRGWAVYLNTEIQSAAWEERCRRQNAALGIEAPQVFHASTRGGGLSVGNFIPAVESAIAGAAGKLPRVDLLCIDPFYTLAAGVDENAAGEVAEIMLGLQALAERLGAAVWIAHHFSKGAAAGKSAMDRASGSGVFARSVDNFLTLTENPQGQIILETYRRNARAPEPMELVFDWPLWKSLGEAEPIRPPQVGASVKYTAESVVAKFSDGGIAMRWRDFVAAGIPESSLKAALARAIQAGLVEKCAEGYKLTFEGTEEWSKA